ncbi:RNA polymerase sigma factor [Alkalicoccobacillus porphyridii]|uniref:RNA polymerase sigma factor n=1 Tax=Alkalicoccobacillus porphyridii TaxID=2597270 RepID=A0A554A163_9BACI|nr:RNA polymerase sigma factor [Alkalicoccobacillus porphyridii]TSB47376.1 RNA polymerase sigma factor [Alkalicoccobacillus porphyridii]
MNRKSVEMNHQLMLNWYSDLKVYCRYLASSPWEAEDLLQETFLKCYVAMGKDQHRNVSKSFLYKIARNTWIDYARKKKLPTEEYVEEQVKGEYPAEYLVRETLELLSVYVSPKQFVLILLIDVFRFTGKEAASLLGDSESAVHTSVHRAREKLKNVSIKLLNKGMSPKRSKENQQMIEPEQFEKFMDGFRKRDVQLIYDTYVTIAAREITITQQHSARTFCFLFTDIEGNLISICKEI